MYGALCRGICGNAVRRNGGCEYKHEIKQSSKDEMHVNKINSISQNDRRIVYKASHHALYLETIWYAEYLLPCL